MSAGTFFALCALGIAALGMVLTLDDAVHDREALWGFAVCALAFVLLLAKVLL